MAAIRHWPPLAQFTIKLLLALASIGLCIGAWRLLAVPAIDYWIAPGEALMLPIRRAGTVAMLLFGYWLFARVVERRRVTEFAFKPIAIASSALMGAVLIALTIGALFVLGNYQVVKVRGFDGAAIVIGTIFVAAIFEEILFRGIVFRLLEQYAGTTLALLLQSLLFAAMHLANDGASVMTLLSVTLLGAFWTLIYVWSRNLWVAGANHAAWNTTIFLSGVPLSGQTEWRAAAPLESSYNGPLWLTGGGFGPEDSLINIVLMAVVLTIMARLLWRRGLLAARA